MVFHRLLRGIFNSQKSPKKNTESIINNTFGNINFICFVGGFYSFTNKVQKFLYITWAHFAPCGFLTFLINV